MLYVYEVLVMTDIGIRRVGIFTKEKAYKVFEEECWFMSRCGGLNNVELVERQIDKAYEGKVLECKTYRN
ncbi:MAG: hypothetical protein J6U54_01570 [Clostridiales bacterium]|nr:hypothetical protein [Clostridiales bacterium]